ncbi:Abortive infection protein [Lysobacter dokdonensis DS-58]|uniref:Abortive infection protein n=1 Tax=Lysobacter dokdonensis DS-58 TaxID=1300345 RepID=A0A0A2X5I7_9GAMM|nr:type II CAAX endopeptidase family protein [Lysobacter dokdonensis]KGQ20514.1 Abortive infection protein [Lysobacter dokdonensis DS-58]
MRTFGMWGAGLLALVMCAGVARAETAPDIKAATAHVEAGAAAAYREQLARFDAAQAAAPDDAALAVARCEFIAQYTDEEYGISVASAPEDFDACEAHVLDRMPNAPEVALFKLDRICVLEKSLAEGERLLKVSTQWPPAMRARLLAKLAELDDAKAQRYALDAVRLDANAPVDDATLARAWLDAGDPAKAEQALEGVEATWGPYGELRFDLAIARKDWTAAVAMIDVRDVSDIYPSLQRFGRLAVAAPSTLAQGQMPVLLFMVLAMGAGLAALPVLLLLPVHYRGLVRRLQHRTAQAPLPRVTLWHAWYGAAVALAVPSMLMVFVAPQMLGDTEGATRMGPGVFALMLWSTCVSLLAMVPVLGVFGKRGLLGDGALWRASWRRIVVYWLALIAIVFALNALFTLTGMDTTTEQTRMVAALAEQAKGASGVLLTLGIVALLGPVFEELVFRGLLLNGMARHLDFRWANGIQALLFACMHADPPRFVFYFAMGLFGGWLVRRTGSLAPAIALHVLNNAWAMGLMVALT